MKHAVIDLAAGCFWGVQEMFDKVPGVVKTMVGYEGGQVDKPTYEQVTSHITGHTETVQVTYNPSKVSLERLLNTFWMIHDPTVNFRTMGYDNYRSAIFYYDDDQKRVVDESKRELEKSGKFNKPVVTEITKATKFWPAEDYHQKFYQKHLGKVCGLF